MMSYVVFKYMNIYDMIDIFDIDIIHSFMIIFYIK